MVRHWYLFVVYHSVYHFPPESLGPKVLGAAGSALQEQYIKEPVEKEQLFDAIHTMPAVRDKARCLGAEQISIHWWDDKPWCKPWETMIKHWGSTMTLDTSIFLLLFFKEET